MMKRCSEILILVLILLMGWIYSASSKELMIADFNRGKKPNLISGDFGAWNKNEGDRSQYCMESFTSKSNLVYGGRGCSLRLDYDVDSPHPPAYNGFWMRLEKIDLTPYKYLTFYVKGDRIKGFTTVFKLIIKNTKGEESTFMVRGIDENWKKILIPLEVMKKEGDFTEAKEMLIIFDETEVTKKVGTIYIDNISLEN